MKLSISFKMDNASFDNHPEFEASRVLLTVGQKILHGETVGKIRDTNGNYIGDFEIEVD